MIEKDDTKQFTVTMGQQDYDDLRDWAHAHGRTVAEFAAQILANRLEENMIIIGQLRNRANKDTGN